MWVQRESISVEGQLREAFGMSQKRLQAISLNWRHVGEMSSKFFCQKCWIGAKRNSRRVLENLRSNTVELGRTGFGNVPGRNGERNVELQLGQFLKIS